jgi:hypothetical protein
MDEKNLTKEKRLAFLMPELGNKPGHNVVVVDQKGKESPRLLGPGETLKRIWYRRAASFVTYAVPRDPNLRETFSRPWQTDDQNHSFTLNYRLEFRIQDPVLLVESLAGDPLQKLEDEVDAVVGGGARRLAWEVIVEGGNLGENLLKDSHDKTDDQPCLWDSLQRFASNLGLVVTKIGVTRTLPETEPVVKRPVEEKKRALMELEHETDVRKEDLQLEKESLTDRRKIAATRSETVRKWVTAAGDEGAIALHQMVEKIEYPDGLPKAVKAVIDGVRILDGAESRPHKGMPASIPLPLLGDGAATGSHLSELLTELTQQFVRLPCDASERKNLLSAALHLVGELIRGEQAEAKVLRDYRRMIDEGFLRNVDALDRDQNKLFKRLKNVEALQKELSW